MASQRQTLDSIRIAANDLRASIPQLLAEDRSGVDRPALRVATLIWAAVNVVQFIVWLTICVAGFQLESPWFLWSLVIPGAVLGAAWWITKPTARSLNR